jgi:hypothetical protein
MWWPRGWMLGVSWVCYERLLLRKCVIDFMQQFMVVGYYIVCEYAMADSAR